MPSGVAQPEPGDDSIAELLREYRGGSAAEQDQLLRFVYDRLHEIATHLMSRERPDHTLQPTVLVHEAWLGLMRQRSEWKSGRQFLRVAALLMRRLLVNHAVARQAAKRGGGRARDELDSIVAYYESRQIDLLELHEALNSLAATDPLAAQVVELRFFAGLEVAEAADVLVVSKSTVERAWLRARMELQRKLG